MSTVALEPLQDDGVDIVRSVDTKDEVGVAVFVCVAVLTPDDAERFVR